VPLALRQTKVRDRLVARLLTAYREAQAKQQIEIAEKEFRAQQGERASTEKEMRKCSKNILHWFKNWVWTYDPRLVGRIDPKTGKTMSPFIRFLLWPKQAAFVTWVVARIIAGKPWLLEKSRDQGATYLLVAIFVWFWLFTPGFKGTFGSRDADLVDSRDNPDSIFEKMRIILRRLPPWMLPEGFDWRKHDNIMQLTNPANGATITGEAGDQMGRGGRSTCHVVDEAAFVPRIHKVEAALSGTTDCVGWVSSVNPQEGMGNFFARKRHTMPPDSIQRLHYLDDPRKNATWAADKKASLSDPTTWEAEYEINYQASAEGVCIPAAWVRSAQLLGHLMPHVMRAKIGISGGDVGGGKALSVRVDRFGPIVLPPETRAEADTTGTALWMLEGCCNAGTVCLNFDSVGIGEGVQSTLMRADESEDTAIKAIAASLQRVPINVGMPASDRVWPDDRTSEEMFGNLKAEIWWLARQAFQRSHFHWLYLTKQEGGRAYSESEIIILGEDDQSMTLASQISLPKYARNEKGKIVIESKEALKKRGIPSPDHAEAFVLTFIEPPDDGISGIRLDVTTFHRENPMRIGN
jgi:phage terminase large subunit